MTNKISLDSIVSRKKIPEWIRVKAPSSKEYFELKELAKNFNLHTVCQEAACPNIAECWSKKHATFMILGSICTRSCRFCNVKTGKPMEVDKNEPKNIATSVKILNLKHVVITSVDRDDLSDGGAGHFAEVIYEIRTTSPNTTIEVLTPDFLNKKNAEDIIINAKPDVFNHNIETVNRLFKKIKIGGNFNHSINLLEKIKTKDSNIFTKSGIIAGMGETNEEIFETMDILKNAKVDFITIGQYLKPRSDDKRYIDINRFVSEKEFEIFKKIAIEKGFSMVSSSPLTRSSYHADEDFLKLKNARSSIE